MDNFLKITLWWSRRHRGHLLLWRPSSNLAVVISHCDEIYDLRELMKFSTSVDDPQ